MYLFKINGFTCQCETVDQLYAAVGAPVKSDDSPPPDGSVHFSGPNKMSQRWAAVDRYIQENGLRRGQTKRKIYQKLFGPGATA